MAIRARIITSKEVIIDIKRIDSSSVLKCCTSEKFIGARSDRTTIPVAKESFGGRKNGAVIKTR